MRDLTRREFTKDSAASAVEMMLLGMVDTDSEDRKKEEEEEDSDELKLYGSVESSVDYERGVAGVTIDLDAGPETVDDYLDRTNLEPNSFDPDCIVPLEKVEKLEKGSKARRLLDPNLESPSMNDVADVEDEVRELHMKTENKPDSEYDGNGLQPISIDRIDDNIHMKISGLTDQPELDDRNIFGETVYHGNSFDAWVKDGDAYLVFSENRPSEVLPEEDYVNELSRDNRGYNQDQREVVEILDAAGIKKNRLSYPE